MSSKKKKNADVDAKEKKRQQIVNEIYETEKTYKEDLDTLINVFKEPISDLGLLSDEDTSCIFQNVEQLAALHQKVLNSLNRVGTNLYNEVGWTFVQQSAGFEPYREYCAGHERADAVLTRCEQNSQVLIEFLGDCKRIEETHRLTLHSFLIKPVQRICKYPLLLTELIKVTPEGHMDAQNLAVAKKKLEAIALGVNESKRDADMLEQLAQLEGKVESLPFSIVRGGRKILYEGILQQKGHRDKRGFVFNDALMLVSSPNHQKTYKFKQMIPMSVLLLRELEDSKEHSNAFELVRMDEKKVLILSARNAAEKAEWVHFLNLAIEATLTELRKQQLSPSPKESINPGKKFGGRGEESLVDRKEWYKRYRRSCDVSSESSESSGIDMDQAMSKSSGTVGRSKTSGAVLEAAQSGPVVPPRSDMHSKKQSAATPIALPAMRACASSPQLKARDPNQSKSPQATVGRFGDPMKAIQQKQAEIDDLREKLGKECKANAELRSEVAQLRSELEEERERVVKLEALVPKKKRK